MLEAALPVAYRAVLLAGVLLVLGLLFRQLATLLLAVLMTVIIAIPLSAGATKLERRGVPAAGRRARHAAAGRRGRGRRSSRWSSRPSSHQTNQFVDQVPGIVNDLEKTVGDVTGDRPSEVGDKIQRYLQRYTDHPQRLIGPVTSIGVSVAGVAGALVDHADHRVLHRGAAAAARGRRPATRPAARGSTRARSWTACARLDRLDAGRRLRHVHLGDAALHRPHDHRARLRARVRGDDRVARGGSLLRRDRRRNPAGRCSRSRCRRARRSRCWSSTSPCSRSRAT